MSIFILALYSCVSTFGTDALLIDKSCRWDLDAYYASESRCHQDGLAARGRPVHEFSVVIGSTGRKVESHRCSIQWVK